MNYVALGVFVGTLAALVARQLVGRGPGLWVILLGGGLLTVATGALSPSAAGVALTSNLAVFAFLIALFLFAAGLEISGTFEYLARWILGRARRPTDLPLVLFVGMAIMAGFLVNDALVLVGVPFVFAVANRLEAPVRPLLLTVAFAVTVGSVLTPMGNPQNLLVALGSGLHAPVAEFLRYLLVPTAINIVVGGFYVRWLFREEFVPLGDTAAQRFPRIPLLPPGDWPRRLARFPVLLLFPASMGVIIGTDVAAEALGTATLPVYEVALVGAALMLAFSRKRRALIERVDWTILVLFAGLFVLVAGAQAGGILSAMESVIPIPGPGAPALNSLGTIIGASLLGPQVVSNVPWVALQLSVFHSLGYGATTPLAWLALAAGSTLAGNLTLLGAASNLIIVERAEAEGVHLRLGRFVRMGLPLTGITVAVLLACLLVGL